VVLVAETVAETAADTITIEIDTNYPILSYKAQCFSKQETLRFFITPTPSEGLGQRPNNTSAAGHLKIKESAKARQL